MNKEKKKNSEKLNILILSCSTGGGHNAAGHAMEEYFREQGQMVYFPDYLALAGKKVSETVGKIYVRTVQKAPKAFGMVYRIGDAVSRYIKHSPVYYANSAMVEYLEKCLEEREYDAVLVPHLFPAETLTRMKRKGRKIPMVIAVGTDYTSIPFWGETECDYYVVPSEEVGEEFVQAGIPKEKLLPFGIPVSQAYRETLDRDVAAEEIFADDDAWREGKIYLVAGGSMGAGNICQLVAALENASTKNDRILVVCGSNKSVYERMKHEFGSEKRMRIYGWTNKMPLFMKAADVIFTKPGGLTSTEAAVAGCPIVHIDPIPGCETANASYFVRHGYSISAKGSEAQARAGVQLANDEVMRQSMRERQQRDFKGNTTEQIFQFLKEHR